MKLFRLCAFMAATIASPIAIAKLPSTSPVEIQGIWMADDEVGKGQCRKYLAAQNMNDVDATEYLVGSEVIRATRWHSYAEYGEGNSYEIKRVQPVDGTQWRLTSMAYIDNEVGELAIFRVDIEGSKLFWVFESFGGVAVDSWDEHRYFRCASVPPELYAS